MNCEAEKVIYMDNNATTRIAPEVVDAMMPFLTECYGNPSSMHNFGGQVGGAVEKARAQVAVLIGADAKEITFTSCGTESDSTAILSALQAFPEKRHIITTRVEHPAVKNLCENLDRLTGHKHRVTRLQVEADGTLDMETYEEALAEDTAIVSVMWATMKQGLSFPLRRWRPWPKTVEFYFIQMLFRLWVKFPLISVNLISIFFLSPVISCTHRRAWGFCMSNAGLHLFLFLLVDTRKRAGVAGLRMLHPSSGLAGRVSLPVI